jgi:hypothetical protein
MKWLTITTGDGVFSGYGFDSIALALLGKKATPVVLAALCSDLRRRHLHAACRYLLTSSPCCKPDPGVHRCARYIRPFIDCGTEVSEEEGLQGDDEIDPRQERLHARKLT